MQSRTITLHSPLAGIVKRHALQNQAPYSSPDARNVLTSDYSVGLGGRDRLATRPGLTATGATIGVPLNWCEAFWTSSGAKRGILVACENGLWRTVDGTTWVELITDSAGSDFASATVFIGTAYFARGGTSCLTRSVGTTSSTGSALGNGGGGTAPTNCGVVGHHLDRLLLMGDTANSQTVYVSATGDATNWDFSVTDDPSAAYSFTVDEPPTSFISHTRDCAFIGCVDSVVALRGNLNGGGELEKISHYVGPVSQSAWTHDSTGALWFVSRDGLYRIPPGCGDSVTSISREALPVDLTSLNPGTSGTYVSVAFDPRFRCLWIFVDQSGSNNDSFWSYDLQAPGGAWFQHTFTNGPLRVGATLKSASTTAKSALLAINSTGAVYQFDEASSESFDAYVWYGPIQLGGPGMEGIFHAVQATVAASSGAVSWAVFVGGSAEEAFNSTAAFTGANWTAGLNHHQHPRRRGAFGYLKISSTGTARFAMENIDVTLHGAGIRRVN